jgi:hypothetical protein
MYVRRQYVRIFAASFVFLSFLSGCSSFRTAAPEGHEFVLSGATVTGTQNLSPDDLLRGLDLRAGSSVTRQTLQQACDRLDQLRLFYSENCGVRVDGRNLWIDLKVQPAAGPPLMFENFVWTTRKNLLARLKQELPLFTPEIPSDTALNPDVIRVLDKVVAERGIQGHVEIDRFWADKGGGGHVFSIIGIKAPVVACVVGGEDAPSAEQVAKALPGCAREDFSMPLLNWISNDIVTALYSSRGYLHPVLEEPIVQFLGETNGQFPVRVVFPVSPGPQYRFRSVSFEGIARSHSAELLAEWKLRPGDIYDTAYISDFEFKNILNQPWAQHDATSGDTVYPCENVDESTKTVSLTLTVKVPKRQETFSPRRERACGGGLMNFSFVGERFETAPPSK